MSLTAFLPTGAPQILPFIGTPGAATVGHALVWSQTPQGFTLAPISVGPDQFSGVLPVAKGGWGSNTGSFTSPGAITLASGGTNQGITLSPSGTGVVSLANTTATRLQINASSTGIPLVTVNQQAPWDGGNFALIVSGYSSLGGLRINGADGVNGLYLSGGTLGFSTSAANDILFSSNDGAQRLLALKGGGNVGIGTDTPGSPLHIATAVAATSTTTGSLRVGGGAGLTGSIYVGESLVVSGTKINFANLPTADTGLSVGDLWRDGNTVKIKV